MLWCSFPLETGRYEKCLVLPFWITSTAKNENCSYFLFVTVNLIKGNLVFK